MQNIAEEIHHHDKASTWRYNYFNFNTLKNINCRPEGTKGVQNEPIRELLGFFGSTAAAVINLTEEAWRNEREGRNLPKHFFLLSQPACILPYVLTYGV